MVGREAGGRESMGGRGEVGPAWHRRGVAGGKGGAAASGGAGGGRVGKE